MLPNSGQISLRDIAKELGKEGQRISLNDKEVLELAGKTPVERVVLPNNFWGKNKKEKYPYYITLDLEGGAEEVIPDGKFAYANTFISHILISSQRRYITLSLVTPTGSQPPFRVNIQFKSGEEGELTLYSSSGGYVSYIVYLNTQFNFRKYAGQTIYFRLEE